MSLISRYLMLFILLQLGISCYHAPQTLNVSNVSVICWCVDAQGLQLMTQCQLASSLRNVATTSEGNCCKPSKRCQVQKQVTTCHNFQWQNTLDKFVDSQPAWLQAQTTVRADVVKSKPCQAACRDTNSCIICILTFSVCSKQAICDVVREAKQIETGSSLNQFQRTATGQTQNVSKCQQLIWALWQSSRIRSPSGSRRLHQNAMRNAKWCEMQIWGLRAKANQTWSRLNLWAPKSASLKILIGVLLQILQEGLKFSTGKGPCKPDENSTLVYAPFVFSIAVSFPVGCSSCISYSYFPVPVKMHWCTQEMLRSSLAMSAKLKRASPMSVIRCIARCIRCEDCKVMDKELKLQTSTQTQNRHSVQAEHRQSKAKNLQLTSLNKVQTELTALLRTTEYAKEEVSSAMPKRHKIWRS